MATIGLEVVQSPTASAILTQALDVPPLVGEEPFARPCAALAGKHHQSLQERALVCAHHRVARCAFELTLAKNGPDFRLGCGTRCPMPATAMSREWGDLPKGLPR